MLTKIIVLFLVTGALTSPVEEPVKTDVEDHVVLAPVYHASVAVPVADEGMSIPVQVIHGVGRSIENNLVNNVKTTNREVALVQKLNTKCSQRDLSSCVMLKLVSYMNRLLKKANIEVYEGLEITQTTTAVVEEVKADAARSNEDADEEALFSEVLVDKLWNFARSRSLRWNVFGDADIVFSTKKDETGAVKLGVDLSEGRGKNKNLGPLLALGAMKFGMLGAIAFKGLVILVGKALLVGKIALLLSAILALSKLFNQESHVSYEVVAHPHHSSSHGHSHSDHGEDSVGWGRSMAGAPLEAQDMAYSAHAPQ